MKFLLFLFYLLLPLRIIYATDYGTVFMYHRFEESNHPSTNISEEVFRKHLSYLKENNFNVLPVSRLIDFFNGTSSLPEKSVFITIDDGYRSFYNIALPILLEFEFPFSIFISTDYAILSNRKSISAVQGNTPNDKFAKVLLNSNIRIGFIANSAYSTYAAALFPNAVKKGYENWPKATEALLNGEIDGLYRDATEIKKIVYQKPSLSLEYVPVLIDDLVDQKSIYVSTKANMAIGSILDYYLGKEIKIKSDTEIMNDFMSYYQPIK